MVPAPGVWHPEEWVQRWRAVMVRAASERGWVLAAVFADDGGRSGAFHAMQARLRRERIAAVLVPAMSQFAHLPCLAGADRRGVARYLRVPLVILTAGEQ
jgi:hypothetical protein